MLTHGPASYAWTSCLWSGRVPARLWRSGLVTRHRPLGFTSYNNGTKVPSRGRDRRASRVTVVLPLSPPTDTLGGLAGDG